MRCARGPLPQNRIQTQAFLPGNPEPQDAQPQETKHGQAATICPDQETQKPESKKSLSEYILKSCQSARHNKHGQLKNNLHNATQTSKECSPKFLTNLKLFEYGSFEHPGWVLETRKVQHRNSPARAVLCTVTANDR